VDESAISRLRRGGTLPSPLPHDVTYREAHAI